MFGVSIYVMIEAVDGMFMFYVGRLNPLFTIINQNSEAHRFPQWYFCSIISSDVFFFSTVLRYMITTYVNRYTV